MPVYEYRCTVCAKEFEVTQRVQENPLKDCLPCGGKLQKIYRSPGIVFKGSGWHSKDYGK